MDNNKDNINGFMINKNNINLNQNKTLYTNNNNVFFTYNNNKDIITPNNINKIIANKNSPIQNKLNNNNNCNNGFNNVMNKILKLLKDYFHNNNLYLNNIKLISESINEQTLFARCSINDIMLYLNQITHPRFNGVMANMNEKYIKEKLNLINDRLSKIDELKDNMNQNIRNTEIELITYYEENKNFLQRIKILYKYGNDSINNMKEKDFSQINLEEFEKLKKNYNKLLNENNRLKMNIKINNSIKDKNSINNKNSKDKKNINLSLGNIRNNSCSRNGYNTNNSVGILRDELKRIKNIGRNININVLSHKGYKKINSRNKTNSINKANTNTNSKMNSLTLSKTNEDFNKNKKYYINLINDLASMILNFLNDMKNLQENIIKKSSNIKIFKKNFEINKKNLLSFCENIIKNQNSPQKIKDLNINNYNIYTTEIKKIKENNININKNIIELEKKINTLEKSINEKNIKIKNLESEIYAYKTKNNQLMKQLNDYVEKEKNNKNKNGINDINISKIELYESQNNELKQINNNQKKTIDDLNSKIQDEINKNKTIENNLLLLKNENMELKQKINENGKILQKNENFDKIYAEIKEMLKEINDESQNNIKDLLDKDKQFDLHKEKNKNNNKIIQGIIDDKESDEIFNKLNDLKNNQKEYGVLIETFKNYNQIFQQNNNDI
jgi:hypothetical protein